MDPEKLKVTELRKELSARGLDQKGIKAVLLRRLKEALEEEAGEEPPNTEVDESSNEEITEQNVEIIEGDQSIDNEKSFEPEPEVEAEPQVEPEPEPVLKESVPEPMEVQVKQEPQEYEEPSVPIETTSDLVEPKLEPLIKEEKIDKEVLDRHIKETQVDTLKKQHYEAEVKQEPQERQVKEEKRSVDEKSNSYSNERKRKRSRSPSLDRQKFANNKTWKDHEPEIDDSIVQLSWYDSDLNLVIDSNNFLSASPMSDQGFGYIWAGVRSNYGFNCGQVCFEIKLLENNDVSHLEDEPSPHVLRVGWSILSSGMLLGEEPFSYGYGGTGKSSTNCKFDNYGIPFVVGDVVTAYLDYGPHQIVMSFSVNGVWQKEAYTLPYNTFDGQALFPHVLTKNIKFELNFGKNEPWFQPLPGYTWAANVAPDQRVAGPKRPEKRGDCEMLMMCGLPGCGKTVWANEWASNYPEKFYNILGSNNLIDKMKIQGLPRKRNYHGRWDLLIEKCMKCLNKLLEMAHKRRRNYILDQTNVYPSAQKRKMRSFGGFVRRAIVIVPTDEEFKRRVAKREAEEGKDVPDSAVLEMKANFKLPEKGEYFEEVIYTELNEEDARPVVEMYIKEGRDAGFGNQNTFSGSGGRGNKRFRPNERPQWNRDGGGGGGGGGGNFRGSNRGSQIERRGGWQPRGGGSGGWRDRKPGGGYRQGGRDNQNRDQGWRGGGGSRGGRDNYNRDNYGGRDNYGRDDRSRSGNYDRNRRDGPPNRNSRDKRGGGSHGGGGSGGSSAKQGGSGWGNQGYDQGWGQNQGYGQNWGSAWKAPAAQQQGYNNYGNEPQYAQQQQQPQPYNQYGGQGWNQGGNNYAYGSQGMNNFNYGGYGSNQNQGK